MCFFLVFLMVSCTSNTIYKKPKDLIPKDTMTALLSDMFMASSVVNFKNTNDTFATNYLPLVYDKYKIDSARFSRSNIYYTSKVDVYSEILQEIYSQKKKELDSIKKNSDALRENKKESEKPIAPKEKLNLDKVAY